MNHMIIEINSFYEIHMVNPDIVVHDSTEARCKRRKTSMWAAKGFCEYVSTDVNHRKNKENK